eukprot:351532-Chlamydomonas_euryale.AAC.11
MPCWTGRDLGGGPATNSRWQRLHHAGGQAGGSRGHRHRRCAHVRGAKDAHLCSALYGDRARAHHQGAPPGGMGAVPLNVGTNSDANPSRM